MIKESLFRGQSKLVGLLVAYVYTCLHRYTHPISITAYRIIIITEVKHKKYTSDHTSTYLQHRLLTLALREGIALK